MNLIEHSIVGKWPEVTGRAQITRMLSRLTAVNTKTRCLGADQKISGLWEGDCSECLVSTWAFCLRMREMKEMIWARRHLLLIARPVAEARFLIYPRIIFCCFVGDLNHTSARPDIGSRNLWCLPAKFWSWPWITQLCTVHFNFTMWQLRAILQ